MLLVGGVLLVAGGGRGHDEDDAVPDISGRTVERQSGRSASAAKIRIRSDRARFVRRHHVLRGSGTADRGH